LLGIVAFTDQKFDVLRWKSNQLRKTLNMKDNLAGDIRLQLFGKETAGIAKKYPQACAVGQHHLTAEVINGISRPLNLNRPAICRLELIAIYLKDPIA
jgi:hypothetical protein